MAIGVIDTGISVLGGIGGIFGGGGKQRENKRQIRDDLRNRLMGMGMKFLDVDSDDIDSLQILLQLASQNQAVTIRTINNFFPNGGKIPRSKSLQFSQLRQQIEKAIRDAQTEVVRAGFIPGGVAGDVVTGVTQTVASSTPLMLLILAAGGFIVFQLIK